MQSTRILIVEDDPKSLFAFRSVLQDKGLQTVACRSAEEAASYAGDGFDAALLDIRLPGRSGTYIAELLRQKHPDIRLIFMTAYNGVREIEAAFPGSIVLVKPISMEALFGLL